MGHGLFDLTTVTDVEMQVVLLENNPYDELLFEREIATSFALQMLIRAHYCNKLAFYIFFFK